MSETVAAPRPRLLDRLFHTKEPVDRYFEGALWVPMVLPWSMGATAMVIDVAKLERLTPWIARVLEFVAGVGYVAFYGWFFQVVPYGIMILALRAQGFPRGERAWRSFLLVVPGAVALVFGLFVVTPWVAIDISLSLSLATYAFVLGYFYAVVIWIGWLFRRDQLAKQTPCFETAA